MEDLSKAVNIMIDEGEGEKETTHTSVKPKTTAFTQCGCGYYIILLHVVILVRIAAGLV
jgi:hypothetical protein